MKDLYIIGCGGPGREVKWLVERINAIIPTWNLSGFIDDSQAVQGNVINGLSVVGTTDFLATLDNVYVVCAIGSSNVRAKIINKISDYSIRFATLIDPSVIISDRVQIGEGVIISFGAIVTVDIKLGNHVIIYYDCTVGHDSSLEYFVTLYPTVNVSGNTVLGARSEFGTGCQIIQGKPIVPDTIVVLIL